MVSTYPIGSISTNSVIFHSSSLKPFSTWWNAIYKGQEDILKAANARFSVRRRNRSASSSASICSFKYSKSSLSNAEHFIKVTGRWIVMIIIMVMIISTPLLTVLGHSATSHPPSIKMTYVGSPCTTSCTILLTPYMTYFQIVPPRPWRYPPRSPATSCICFNTTSQQARVITHKDKQYFHPPHQALTSISLGQYPSYTCDNTGQIRIPSLILSLLYC